MTIYKEILGEQFEKLHPMLQKRYTLPEGKPFKATGIMKKISGGPKWLSPFFLLATRWKFLFPEQGENIPFRIVNTTGTGSNGEQQVHWERTFQFPKNKRYFNALMSLDSDKNIVKDYLGEPSLFYSELVFFVSEKGHMRIESRKQRFVMGQLEIPLPKVFQGNVQVTEYYIEERDVFSIHVFITNPLIGALFEYEGEFQADDF
ncbi:DUF4166 domain-containing protein [Psychrobacillus lasiicapitis]|uniref:DUF4166 domain-containing protein n=1 Tax=Psychrobacillus lasiicapitis TaxID=1636719 RepID=A0A544SZN3_9BACI|nr:DUF4166 domain-containing protein [Psychrobacillus lasiicapitis]TQR10634.1 DUF4166 domain-containing protein [Psychrobacillus lasiicapitis]GGA43906.1 hypothetical protein GCM10011384_37150 [Psychrobacillus lasiicapitis]